MLDPGIREWVKGKWKAICENPDILNNARQIAEKIISEAQVAVFVNVDSNLTPLAKAMYPAYKSGISHIWFNTDATSNRLNQLQANSLSTVYCYDPVKVEGVMLVGNTFVEKERIWRERLWKKEFEEGYPGGIDDPDYQVLRFDTKWCNCFFDSKSVTFSVDSDDSGKG